MIRSHRVAGLCLLGLASSAAPPAWAADVPRTDPPLIQAPVQEPHLYAPIKVGAVGLAGGVFAAIGIGLLADEYLKYSVQSGGGDGNSCRPCSTSQIAGLRAEYGLSLAFMGVGAVLAITSGILAGLDHRWRRDHLEIKTARAWTLDAGGVHF